VLSSDFPDFSLRFRFVPAAIALLALMGWPAESGARSAFVRVNQVGYEAGSHPFRAYLMSTVPEPGATFTVTNSEGKVVYSAAVGALRGNWGHSKSLTYAVYAIDFSAPGGDTYTISVLGPMTATSPRFPVDKGAVLYPGLLLNTLFFYETERDGPNYIANALRSAPGHLNDESAATYETPLLNSNDLI
jgi:endoglucanase